MAVQFIRLVRITAGRVATQVARLETGAPRSPTPEEAPTLAGNTTRTLAADLLSHAEIDRLLRTCSKRAPSGLRIGEALTLGVKDVDLQEFVVRVQTGKTGKRVVGLDLPTALLVEQWLLSRRKLGVGTRAPLFCTLKGGEVDQSHIRHMMKRRATRAGIEKRAHAHMLRHRFAIDLIKEGADLLTVRDLLGHASASTTQTYLSRIGASDAVAFAQQRKWEIS